MLIMHMPPGAVRDAYAARDACAVPRACASGAAHRPLLTAHHRSHLLRLLTAQAHDWSEASTTRILPAPTDLPRGLSVGERIVMWFIGSGYKPTTTRGLSARSRPSRLAAPFRSSPRVTIGTLWCDQRPRVGAAATGRHRRYSRARWWCRRSARRQQLQRFPPAFAATS
jgi:hypothetical protein